MVLWVLGLAVGAVLGLLWPLPGGRAALPTLRLLPVIAVVALLALLIPRLPSPWGRYLFWGQQLLVLVPLIGNWHIPPVRLILAGAVLNGLAILSGGGKMPVMASSQLMQELPLTHGAFTGVPLNWLGDWIRIPIAFVPPPNHVVASPGDLLIALAVIWLVRDLVRWGRMQRISRHGEEAA